ncbi:MAG TPA: UDP-3-O-(3-hydroxymyristoyl)glucosamine N-acyltransferase [Xanthobacteraceae bacterium]
MMLADIAAALSAPFVGDGRIEIRGIADPQNSTGSSDLALAMTRNGVAALATCRARAAVVVAGSDAKLDPLDAIITVERPRVALAILTNLFGRPASLDAEIHATAVVAPDAEIAAGVGIGPLAVVGPRARIGAGTMIHAHVTIGADACIGSGCLIYPGVRVGDRVRIGDRVILHHNVSIGADGFSFVPADRCSVETAKALGHVEAGNGRMLRVSSIGTVVLGDDVEVGANSAVDRATLAATSIGRNTKIDNLVQIAHNVVIGESCLICGMVGISGSVRIGDRVMLGGGVGVADNLSIGADAVIAAGSAVASNVADGAVLIGRPAVPRERAFEQLRLVGRLRPLFDEVGELKKRIESLERPGRAGPPAPETTSEG